MPSLSWNGKKQLFVWKESYTGSFRDNDNNILEPKNKKKMYCISSFLVGVRGAPLVPGMALDVLATVSNPLLPPVPRGWFCSHFTVEEKSFNSGEMTHSRSQN